MSRSTTKAWKRKPLAERNEIQAHEAKLRKLACMASGYQHDITLHHTHGGSMKQIGVHVGMGQKSNDWLQIPLTRYKHIGNYGIDGGLGVLRWEKENGSQVDMLIRVCELTGTNVFEKAGIDGVSIN